MNYSIRVSVIFLIVTSLVGCSKVSSLDKDEGWYSHRPMLILKEKLEEKKELKIEALKLLDKVLSPFEDITEYAFDENIGGMKKSLVKIKNNQEFYPKLAQKIKQLEIYISLNDYTNTALLSVDMFKFNIDNFKYSKNIEEQIHIENLDYVGFEILALLNKKSVDFNLISKLITKNREHWLAIRSKVKDENSIDAFDFLFEGLELNVKNKDVKNKDVKILKVLASMDLALVDIIEKKF